MRIISGKFKGKKILEPKDIKTRPLKDLTKESIFNILQHSNKIKINIEKSNVLDIFSGVGSFGLECLSRGVLKVTFIENYKKVLPILKKNLDNFKLVNNYKIIESNVYEHNTFKILKDKFDIIFLDPPYKDDNLKLVFDFIQKENILNNEGIIILHRHKNTKIEIPLNFKIIEEKKYGISKILFICV